MRPRGRSKSQTESRDPRAATTRTESEAETRPNANPTANPNSHVESEAESEPKNKTARGSERVIGAKSNPESDAEIDDETWVNKGVAVGTEGDKTEGDSNNDADRANCGEPESGPEHDADADEAARRDRAALKSTPKARPLATRAASLTSISKTEPRVFGCFSFFFIVPVASQRVFQGFFNVDRSWYPVLIFLYFPWTLSYGVPKPLCV